MAFVGIALVCLAMPLLLELVPRNGWYGYRTAATRASDEAWYVANRRAGGWACATGVVLIVADVLL